MGFPERANPNRPVPPAGEFRRGDSGEAAAFTERSDPRHAHRPLNEEQRELVTRYLPMAQRLARQVAAKMVHPDELEAEAYAALVDAARTFEPGRGVDFSIFARPRIMGAIRAYRRFLFHANWRGDHQASPVFERLQIRDNIPGRVLAMAEPDPSRGPEFEVAEEAEAIIRRLPQSEATACRLLYLEGKSCGEAAEVLGCSKGYVSRLHSEAIERIRRVHQELRAG